MSLKENYFKLRQQHDQSFHMEGKPVQNKYLGQMIEINPKSQGCENHGHEFKMESYIGIIRRQIADELFECV